MTKLALALCFVVAIAPASVSAAPDAPPADLVIDAATRAQVIDVIVAAVRDRYVFPALADKLASALRGHAYDRITSARAFADALERDLQAVGHDKHLGVRFSPEVVGDFPDPQAALPAEIRAKIHARATQTNAGFVKVERLAGNIGYLRFDSFAPPAEAESRVAAAMTFVADTDALIVDLRDNHGGAPATVSLFVSHFFDAYAETRLNDIYTRATNQTRQYWVLPSVPGPRYLDRPVYVLTSHDTFSGAEECAYDLQTQKRATVVGEVTGGGANPGGPVKLAEHFTMFLPTGRAINPITGTNWEGTGVKPDVAVAAAKALDTAYLDALRAQRARVRAADMPQLAREIDDALAARRR